jgi:hypothetical protein
MANMNLIRGVIDNPKVGKYLFYVALVLYLLAQFSTGTMLYESYLYDNFAYQVIYCAIALVLVKIFVFDGFSDFKEMMLYVAIGLLILVGCNNAIYYDIIYYYIFMVGARNIEFDGIVKIFLVTIGAGLVVTVLAAKLGLIMGLTIGRSDSPVIRYALGTVYATDLAARTFYLQLMYVLWRKFKLTVPEYIAGFAFTIMIYIITDTRVDFALMIATLLLSLGYKYVINVLEFLKFRILTLIGLVAIFGMIGLTYIYTSKIGILRILDKILSTRLQNGHGAFTDYNVTLFGQIIPQHGNGGLQTHPFHYFFIDCTFVRILMMNGLIVFILLIGALCYMLNRFMENKAYTLIVAMILIVISSLIDHHMPELAFNVVFLAMFANIDYFKDNSRSWI